MMEDEQLEPTSAENIEITTPDEPEIIDVPIDDTPEPPQETPQAVEEKKPFDPKRDKVEFSTPEQQARFNEVFRDKKKSDQRNEMLTGLLQQYVDLLEETKSERAQAKVAETETTLMRNLIEAKDLGDDAAYAKALNALVEFSAGKQAEKIVDKKVNSLLQNQGQSEQAQAEYVATAMQERAPDGEYLRPWLQETDQNFGKAMYELTRIAAKYEGSPDQLQKSLFELDQVMRTSVTKKEPPKQEQPQTRAPNPMQGTNLTNHKPRATIKMTRAEMDIVKKLEQHSGRKIELKNYAARRDSLHKKGGK